MSDPICGEHGTHADALQRAQQQLLPERNVRRLAELYKALGNPTRIQIMSALAVSELCVHELADLLELSQSAISHQLRVLRSVELVTYRKEGKHVIYDLDDDHVRSIFDSGLEHIHHQIESIHTEE